MHLQQNTLQHKMNPYN